MSSSAPSMERSRPPLYRQFNNDGGPPQRPYMNRNRYQPYNRVPRFANQGPSDYNNLNRFSGPVSYDSNQPPPPQQRYRNNPYNNRGGGGGGGRRGGGGDGNYQQQPNRFYHDYGNHNKGDVRNRLGPLKHQQTINESDYFDYTSEEPRYTKQETQKIRNRLIRNVNCCRHVHIHRLINKSALTSDESLGPDFNSSWHFFIGNSNELSAISDDL